MGFIDPSSAPHPPGILGVVPARMGAWVRSEGLGPSRCGNPRGRWSADLSSVAFGCAGGASGTCLLVRLRSRRHEAGVEDFSIVELAFCVPRRLIRRNLASFAKCGIIR